MTLASPSSPATSGIGGVYVLEARSLHQELLGPERGGCRAEEAEHAHRLRESDWGLVPELHALEVPLLPQDCGPALQSTCLSWRAGRSSLTMT